MTSLPTATICTALPRNVESAKLLLACLEALDYPRGLVHLDLCLIFEDGLFEDRALEGAVEDFHRRTGNDFSSIKVLKGKTASRPFAYSLAEFSAGPSAVLLVVGPSVFLRPQSLRALVALNVPMVAPLLLAMNPARPQTNFAAAVTADGHPLACEYDQIIREQKLRGVFIVPLVHAAVLIHRDAAERLSFTDSTSLDPAMSFSESARAHGIVQYVDNREVYGVLDSASPRAVRIVLNHSVPVRYQSPIENIDTFILYGGIGDQRIWLSLLPAFRRYHARKLTVVVPTNAVYLAEMFAGRSFDKLSVQQITIDHRAAQVRQLQLPSNAMLASHLYYGDSVFPNYEDLATQLGVSVVDVVRILLGLPSDAPLSAPEVPAAAHTRAAAQFHGLGLPVGRTVLLSATANSWHCCVNDHWWADAATHLTASGLTVVFNTGNRGRAFSSGHPPGNMDAPPGARVVDISLADIIPFVELCGYFLGTRSGLCDLLAEAHAHKIVVVPHDTTQSLSSRRMGAFWSVKTGFDRPEIVELNVPKDASFDPQLVSHWMGESQNG